MNEQYGNSGYNRVEDTGYNNGQQGDRYNNFVKAPYDNASCRSSFPSILVLLLTNRRRDGVQPPSYP
jgi:hypothetical protein